MWNQIVNSFGRTDLYSIKRGVVELHSKDRTKLYEWARKVDFFEGKTGVLPCEHQGIFLLDGKGLRRCRCPNSKFKS